MSCVTSMSRMGYAFSRDKAIPGSQLWSKVDKNGTPTNAIIGGIIACAILTLPALYKAPNGAPVAFYAVVSIAVIGLYLAFLIPIYLRLKMGSAFQPGPWTLGARYKWMCTVAIIEIVVISIYFIMPLSPGGIPGNKDFDWTLVNYAPLAVGAVGLAITAWWFLSASKWFSGPKTTVDQVDEPVVDA